MTKGNTLRFIKLSSMIIATQRRICVLGNDLGTTFSTAGKIMPVIAHHNGLNGSLLMPPTRLMRETESACIQNAAQIGGGFPAGLLNCREAEE